MNLSHFYREQADAQTRNAGDASLQNVRDRAERAAAAWANLAARNERADEVRAQVAAEKKGPSEVAAD